MYSVCLSQFLMCWCVQGGVNDVFRFTTFCVQFVCYVALFVLNLIPEPRSVSAAYALLQDDVTEVRTFVNRAIFIYCVGACGVIESGFKFSKQSALITWCNAFKVVGNPKNENRHIRRKGLYFLFDSTQQINI